MKNYIASFDIGTNSSGWACLDENYKLISKKMPVTFSDGSKKRVHKNFWGVSLFDEGETAAERRSFRSTRRRYNRRKFRLDLLNQFFEEEILKVDPTFLIRLSQSFTSPKDPKGRNWNHILFIDKDYTDKDYFEEYKTIYHLRKELVDNPEKKDIRLVYLAVHHIIKYRGNFLYEDSFFGNHNEGKGLDSLFKDLLTSIDENLTYHEETAALLLEKESVSQKVENLMNLYETKDKRLKELFILILGNKGSLKNLFNKEELGSKRITVNDEEFEEWLASQEDLTYEEEDMMLDIKRFFNLIQMELIISGASTEKSLAKVSTSMVKRYKDHCKQLKALKEFVKNHYDSKMFYKIFKEERKDNYVGYIKGFGKDYREKATVEAFYAFLKKELKDQSTTEFYQGMISSMEKNDYLLKQRINENGALPHQFHGYELEKILENQGMFYPFLKENKEKIMAILNFRIPYYVGPLTDSSEMSPFAWMKKNNTGKIYPWNFDEMVNKEASAEEFINRMKSFDTYLPGEPVLPKFSLLYQKFEVLNELNKIKVDGKPLKEEVKQRIFNELFKTQKIVKHDNLKKWLVENGFKKNEKQESIMVEGTQKESQFASSLDTYNDFVKIFGKEIVDSPLKQDDLEEVILNISLFEDKKILRQRLKKSPLHLTTPQIKQLLKKRYQGWGRLSKEFIDGRNFVTKDKENPEKGLFSLIDVLWHTNLNMMQIINKDDYDFKEKIKEAWDSYSMKDPLALENIEGLAGSPAIKRGIYQTVKIMKELVAVTNEEPKRIVLEVAREDGKKVRTVDRKKALENAYKDLKTIKQEYNEEVAKDLKEADKLTDDWLYLYYRQNGKCMYSGKSLGSPGSLLTRTKLEIDHILPQSYIKDDSLTNRVLVFREENQRKSDGLLKEEIIKKQFSFWQNLLKSHLISKETFNRLTTREIREGQAKGFINRQLVETRQIIKNVAMLFQQAYPNTEVITLKAKLTTDFREKFDLPKIRFINNYHHAQDAYLNGVIGIMLARKYKTLNADIIYGDYIKFDKSKKNPYQSNGFFLSQFLKDQISEDGEIIWKKDHDIEVVKKNFASPQCNFVRKVDYGTGEFYSQTIYRKDSTKKNMYPLKKGKNPELYGGYASFKEYGMRAVEYQQGKKIFKKIVGVPTVMKDYTDEEFITVLSEQNPKWKEIRFISKIIPLYQLAEYEGQKVYLISSQGQKISQEAHLTLNELEKFKELKNFDKISTLDSNTAVEFLLFKIKQNKLLSNDKIDRIKLAVANANKELLKEVIKKMATIFNSNIRYTDLSILGLPKEFGRVVKQGGYNFTNITLIHLSPTGLYERRELL